MQHRSSSGSQVEALESRLLLSTTPPSLSNVHAPIAPPPLSPSFIVPYTTLAASMTKSTVAIGALMRSELKLVRSLHVLVAPSVPPARNTTGVSSIAFIRSPAPVPAPVGTIAVTSVTTGSLGEDAVRPIVVVASPPPVFPTPTTSSAHQPAPSGGGTTSQTAQRSAATPVSLPPGSPPASRAATSTGKLPNASHVEFDGSLSASEQSVTIVVPVSPTTRALGFTLNATDGSRPSSLEVDQVSLVDGDGNTVAQLGPVWNPETDSPAETVTLALDHAPAGGSVVLQISGPVGAASQVLSGLTNDPSAAGGVLPFVIDVQRLDSSGVGAAVLGGPTNPAGNTLVTAGSPLGTLSWTSTSGVANSSSGPAASLDLGVADSSAIALADGGNSNSTGGDPDGLEISGPGDFSGRIALGPLVSRGAAPLGPNLATVTADPAPSVDRYERALSQEIDERDASKIDEPLARSESRIDRGDVATRPDEGRPSDELGSPGGAYVAAAGLGALPLMVSASTNGEPTADLEALLAAMPGAPHGEAGPRVAGTDDPDVHASLAELTAPASSSIDDGRPAPDYLTSACVLAVGMGLTAGPLIPDLLQLIPRRSPRRQFVPAGDSVGSTPSRRRFGDWLRRRLV
jgi:hypothetical protein